MAWCLAMGSCLFSSYIVMLYGLRFGYARSVEWLISFFTTMGQNVIFMEPIRVLVIAAIVALIFNTAVEPLSEGIDIEQNIVLGKFVLRVFTLPCSTTVCGSFHCQPLRLRSCIVSGPLIGQHPPADLIAYLCGPVRGSGCIRKCYFTLPNVGVFVNALSPSYINVEH